MKNITVYFVDDILEVVYNKKVFSFKLKDIIEKGKITDKGKFIEEFNRIMKKEKIKSKLFGDKIFVVKNDTFSNADLLFLEIIFEELGFVKIEYINIQDLLNLDATYIEVNNSYIIIYLDKTVYVDLEYFKDLVLIINYLKHYFKNEIILFGKNKVIPQINVDGLNIYYYDNYNSFITYSLLNVNKYDG